MSLGRLETIISLCYLLSRILDFTIIEKQLWPANNKKNNELPKLLLFLFYLLVPSRLEGTTERSGTCENT